MIINNTLFVVASIFLAFFILIGLSVFMKRKFDSYYGVFFGLILSGFGFGAIQAAFGKIYLIQEDHKVKAFRNIGKVQYTFENKDTIVIEFPRGKTGIINNSSSKLIIDEITYGPEGYYRNSTEFGAIINKIDSNYKQENLDINQNIIGPFSFKALDINKHTIDFFFNDEIPSIVEEYGTHGNITKYWLHEY